MPATVDSEKCDATGDCIDVCPTEAISFVGGVALVDPDMCADCGACVDACPLDAIELE